MADLEVGSEVVLENALFKVEGICTDYGLKGCYRVKGPSRDNILRWCANPRKDVRWIWGQGSMVIHPNQIGQVEENYGYVFDEPFAGNRRATLFEYTEPPSTRRKDDGSAERIAFSSSSVRIAACLNVIELFRELERNECFLDFFSSKFLILNLETGEVMLDLVGMASESTRRSSYSYIRPSVLSGTAPDKESNAFTLAAVLFHLICGNSQFEGSNVSLRDCLDPAFFEECYVEKPVFVYDPQDDSNRPVRGIHGEVIETWEIIPDTVRQGFVKAFSPSAGPVPDLDEWTRIMVYMRSSPTVCCKRAYYLDDSESFVCPRCGGTRPVFTVGPYRMVFGVEMELNPIHIDPSSLDYRKVVASVMESPKSPGVYGLKNGSDNDWTYWYEDESEPQGEDSQKHIAVPGKSAKPVSKGMIIDFGKGYTAHLL